MTNPEERPNFIKYYILHVTSVGSLLCDLFIFTYLIRHWRREILAAPHNHVILCILVVSFIQKTTDVPFYLYYLRHGEVLVQNEAFCLPWIWLDYSFIAGNLHLLTWCCVERHFFIFNSTMMKQRVYLLFLHYIPLAICSVYLPLFYASVLFIQKSCTNVWNYTLPTCGIPCYAFSPGLVAFDWLFHYAAPTLILLVVNTLLVARTIWQKVKRQRPVQWARQRRLIIQLTLISILFLIFLFPLVIVGVIQAVWIPGFLSDLQYHWFTFLAYLTNQFLPFVIVGLLPALRRTLRKYHTYLVGLVRRRIQIQPS